MPGESHRQRSLAGYGPEGRKELDTTEATKHTPSRVNINENYEHFESIQFYFSIMTTIFNNFKKIIKQSQRVMMKDDYMTLEH